MLEGSITWPKEYGAQVVNTRGPVPALALVVDD